MIVKNEDVDPGPYDNMKDTPRPGHADLTARVKYGNFNDHRGGGIFSGRITVAFVLAGSIAKQMLSEKGVRVNAHTVQVGKVKMEHDLSDHEIERAKEDPVGCAHKETSKRMMKEILQVKEEGDSIGGIIECRIWGVPFGVGEPLFDSIESIRE
jgi:chorismate synthase